MRRPLRHRAAYMAGQLTIPALGIAALAALSTLAYVGWLYVP